MPSLETMERRSVASRASLDRREAYVAYRIAAPHVGGRPSLGSGQSAAPGESVAPSSPALESQFFVADADGTNEEPFGATKKGWRSPAGSKLDSMAFRRSLA